jgi:amino acid transporter
VRVLGTFPALSFLTSNFIFVPFSVTYGQLLAVAAATSISILNYVGIKKAGDFQLVFTLLKIVIILSIVVIGFGYSGGSWQNLRAALLVLRVEWPGSWPHWWRLSGPTMAGMTSTWSPGRFAIRNATFHWP